MESSGQGGASAQPSVVSTTILLVEDEPQRALDQKELLNRSGYEVVLAASGDEALREARERSDISLILMDIDLGSEGDGIDVAGEIQRFRSVPVVFLSSHTDPSIIERAEQFGPYGYVEKSCGAQAMVAAVRMGLRLFSVTEELRAAKARSDALLEALPDMMFLFSRDGVIEDFRAGLSPKLREPPQGFLGKPLSEALPPELVEVTTERIEKVITTGKLNLRRYSMDLDGEISHFESRMVPCGDNAALSVVRDVSDEYLAAQAVADRTEAEARLQRQLDQTRHLIREVHHRIKNNFASIESAIRLRKGNATGSEARTALSEMLSMVGSNRALYERLLQIEEGDHLPAGPTISEVTRRVVDAFSGRDRIRLRLAVADVELETARTFPLVTIIVELLTNAIKYAYPEPESGEITVGLQDEGVTLLLSVCDHGCGFDPAAGEGAGGSLGLTLSAMLAEQIDGSFRMESAPGRGSCGKVRFPKRPGTTGERR
ncbi:MAG: response regulator [Spirochaetaceae bacterium]